MLPFLSSGGVKAVKDSQAMNCPKVVALHRHLCLHVKVNLFRFLLLFFGIKALNLASF